MHGSRTQVSQLLRDLAAGTVDLGEKLEIVVSPTFLHLGLASDLLKSGNITLAAQNLCSEPQGAFTGEVSAAMLAEYGVKYVLAGHSERREIFGESDQLVAAKFKAAQENNLIPVLCIGESLRQREQASSDEVVVTQLDAVINSVGVAALRSAVIAYEPIWAIGTGQTASPEQAQCIHQALRTHIGSSDAAIAASIRIIYGGSVKASNAAELFSQPDIDGGLVGGASLEAKEFVSICKSAD